MVIGSVKNFSRARPARPGILRASLKAALSILLLLAVALSASAQSALTRVPRVSLFGQDYVRIDDWARGVSLQSKWISKTEMVVTSKWSRVVFTMDQRKILINGVHVWLSAPIAGRNGALYITPVDVTTALQPVLFPKKMRAGQRVQNIVLDPGHGGKDVGEHEGREQEKKYTLLLAKELSDQLTKAGFKVSLTRNSDSFIELPNRPEIARKRGADLFLCLHFNSAGKTSDETKGVETYCLTPSKTSSTADARGVGAGAGSSAGNLQNDKNMLLAHQLQKAIINRTGLEDRGVRRARFAVLRPAEMPAVLIEGGFMSSPSEAKKIYDPAWRKQMASAIVEGVKGYQKQVEP